MSIIKLRPAKGKVDVNVYKGKEPKALYWGLQRRSSL